MNADACPALLALRAAMTVRRFQFLTLLNDFSLNLLFFYVYSASDGNLHANNRRGMVNINGY
jgi:hypothetical protein